MKERKFMNKILCEQLKKLAEDQKATNIPEEDKDISVAMSEICRELDRSFLLTALVASLCTYFVISCFVKFVGFRR